MIHCVLAARLRRCPTFVSNPSDSDYTTSVEDFDSNGHTTSVEDFDSNDDARDFRTVEVDDNRVVVQLADEPEANDQRAPFTHCFLLKVTKTHLLLLTSATD